jgi:UDP-N-acetylmuramoylalanine--D-glutamate ligase
MNTAQMMTMKETNNAVPGVGLNAEPTLVVGLGKTGLSCVRFLVANGVPVAVTDSRANPPCLDEFQKEFKDVSCSVGGFENSLFEWAKHLVVSPGVPVDEPVIQAARKRGVEIIGDVELFARVAKAPVAAITGSNGKSTVTMLVSEMAKSAGKDVLVGGNIGTPVLDLLLQPAPDLYVLELSSFQLEITESLDAVVSVVLNISPDHMDRYRDIDHYASSKQRIYRLQQGLQKGVNSSGHGMMIVNRDDATVMSMVEKEREYYSFGLDEPIENNFGRVSYQDELWLTRGSERLLPVSELRLAGEHNQANVLAALALGEQVGLPMIAMLDAVRNFTGLPHRTQWVADIYDVAWYNDSKGTNVGATLSAIQGFSSTVVLIAGGQGKGADFSPLRDAVAAKARAVILLGEDASVIESAIAGVVPVILVKDMEGAVNEARSLSQPGDVVLLSPACASFDMYAGFEARGDAFIRAVHNLQNRELS